MITELLNAVIVVVPLPEEQSTLTALSYTLVCMAFPVALVFLLKKIEKNEPVDA